MQKRHFELNNATVLLITKVLAGSSVAYFGLRYLKFRPTTQRQFVQKALHRPLDIHIDQSIKILDRPVEIRFLRRFLRGMPSGPLIVVGPTGSGKSHLMKRVLNGRKNTFYVDFRKEPVVTGEEFMGIFVENTGYRIPTPNELTKILFREETRKNKITPQEAEMALDVITEVLKREKADGWRNGVPVICLDDFHLNLRTGSDVDPYWAKFLDWTLHIADSKLAHVVIVPSQAYVNGGLDNYAPLRAKRIQLFVDYPRKDTIRHYVWDVVSKIYNGNKSISIEEQKQIVDWIVNCIGGQLEDLDQVLTALKRGDHFGNVLRRMITDSVSMVEERLEAILQQADSPPSGKTKEDVFKQYLRLWKLIECLRENEYVNRRDLVRLVFNEHTRELAEYVSAGLATYVNQKPVDPEPVVDEPKEEQYYFDPELIQHHVHAVRTRYNSNSFSLQLKMQQNPSSEATEAQQPEKSWWDWIFGLARRTSAVQKVPDGKSASAVSEVASGTSSLSSSATEASGSGNNNNDNSTTAPVDEEKKKEEEMQAYNSMLNASLDSVLVSAGSPRIRIAFDLLVKDPRMIEQRNAVQLHLKMKEVKDKIERTENLKKQLFDERGNIVKELDMYISKSTQYKEELGQEILEARIRRIMNYETHIDTQLAQCDKTLEDLQKQKQELEAQGKQTQRKI